MEETERGRKMTPQAALELAAPHTWPASVAPVTLGTLLAAVKTGGHILPGILLSTLCAAVLLQCAVNTLNDYFDFVKGTDTLENSDDPTDAALVYHGIAPRSALALGVGFLALAALAGAYTVYAAGWVPLIYGLVGGAVVVIYSGGKLPISYLPLGECFSGVVMGGLIPAACYAAQTGERGLAVFRYAIPMILTIAMIMLTNNTCDIERDRAAGRRTLPVLLGREKSTALLRLLAVAAPVLMGWAVCLDFPRAAFFLPVLAVGAVLQLWGLWRVPVNPQTRGMCMGKVLRLHVCYSTFYCVMLGIHLIREVAG